MIAFSLIGWSVSAAVVLLIAAWWLLSRYQERWFARGERTRLAVFNNNMRIAIAGSVVLFASSFAHGVVVDGQLGDWGVTPFTHWTPTVPNTGFIVDNWGDKPGQTGAYPHGGEVFDLEAGYTTSDQANLYIAIVSSLPEAGANDSYGRPNHIMPGDIAISLNGVSGYDWGIIGSGPQIGTVVHNPTWSLPDGSVGIPANGPSTLSGGTQTGYGIAKYVDAGALEQDGSHTYVIEMAIPWSSFQAEGPIQAVQLHYTMTCGNDALSLGMTALAPEPSVIGMVAIALVGIPLRMRMRSRRIMA